MPIAHPIFTVSGGVVRPGVKVKRFTLKKTGKNVPAILVGLTGRRCRLGIIPVYLPGHLFKMWEKGKNIPILAASLGRTGSGRPKLNYARGANSLKAFVFMQALAGEHCQHDYTGPANWRDDDFGAFPGKMLATGTCSCHCSHGLAVTEGFALLSSQTTFRVACNDAAYHYRLRDGKIEKYFPNIEEEMDNWTDYLGELDLDGEVDYHRRVAEMVVDYELANLAHPDDSEEEDIPF